MVTIVRDRIQDMINRKLTLEQAEAARPTLDYDAEYGNNPAEAKGFVEAVYKSLVAEKSK